MESAACEYPMAQEFQKSQSSYTIFCPGDSSNSIENYLLVAVDSVGFVVIRQTIDIEGEQ